MQSDGRDWKCVGRGHEEGEMAKKTRRAAYVQGQKTHRQRYRINRGGRGWNMAVIDWKGNKCVPCPWDLGGSGDRRLYASGSRSGSRVGLELSGTPAPTNTALCEIGKSLFVTARQGWAQGLSNKCTTLQNVHRMHCVRASERKATSLSFLCLFCWQLSNLQGDIALFVFRLTGFPLWENVKYYLSYCGDYWSCARNESRLCTMISLHNLGDSSILFVDLSCTYSNPYEVRYTLWKTSNWRAIMCCFF